MQSVAIVTSNKPHIRLFSVLRAKITGYFSLLLNVPEFCGAKIQKILIATKNLGQKERICDEMTRICIILARMHGTRARSAISR